jgi:Rps23 Pro-64 3,4-dihydroxylase Tpa1-like proline 4-hydroxylase
MNLECDYKIYDLDKLLDSDKFTCLGNLVHDFNIELNEIKSALGFLQWSDRVQNRVSEIDLLRFNRIEKNYEISYDDFQFLRNLNEEYSYYDSDYFNFFLTHPIQCLKDNGIYEILSKVYQSILFDLFKKEIKNEHKESLMGNINVYPKGSFIRKHTDNDPDGNRLFTILFFLNDNRTYSDGSILKLYTNNGVVEIIPDFKKCILIEHQKYNYTHEVTKNISSNVRYSIYSPFTINDYNLKLMG